MKPTGISEVICASRILEAEEGFGSYLEASSYDDLSTIKVARDWMERDVSILAYDFWTSPRTGFYKNMDVVRKAVCLCIAYQLGFRGFLNFKNAVVHMNDGNFGGAAIELMDSKWARASTYRAERYASMLETGEINDYYKCVWDQTRKEVWK